MPVSDLHYYLIIPLTHAHLAAHLQKLSLQLRAQLEGVKELRPAADDFTLMVKLKCTSCHEEHPKWVGITPTDEVEMQGGKGVANYVMHCSVSRRRASKC